MQENNQQNGDNTVAPLLGKDGVGPPGGGNSSSSLPHQAVARAPLLTG